jgi:hypothetical protein
LSFVAGTAAVPLSKAERRADARDYGAEMCSECGTSRLRLTPFSKRMKVSVVAPTMPMSVCEIVRR